MKRTYPLLLLGSGLFIGFLCGSLLTIAQSNQVRVNYDQPVAQVGETVITRGQLAEQAILSAGERLIVGDIQHQALVEEAARRAGVTVSPEEVNRGVAEMLSFARDAMASNKYKDIPRSIWEQKVRMILLAQKMMGITITENEARKFYMQNPSGFARPAMAKLIVIAAASPQKANQALRRLRAGEDPRELAALYTDDPALKKAKGDIGWVVRRRFGPKADEQIFGARDGAGLKPGQWTDVIEIEYVDPDKIREEAWMAKSYAIFYVDDISSAYHPKFEEIRDAAVYAARMAKYSEQAPKWLANLAATIGQEWRASTNLYEPSAGLKPAPLNPETYYKPPAR